MRGEGRKLGSNKESKEREVGMVNPQAPVSRGEGSAGWPC